MGIMFRFARKAMKNKINMHKNELCAILPGQRQFYIIYYFIKYYDNL